jgi:type I restriction enzyme, S subunit
MAKDGKRAATPQLRFPGFREKWHPATVGDLFDPNDKPEKATAFESDKILTVKLHAKGVIRNQRTGMLTGGANYFKRRAGQFIFSKIDLLNGAFGIVPRKFDGFYSSSDIPALSFVKDHSPSFFLNWMTASYEQLEIERTGTSATLKRVSPEKFLGLPIQLPSPAEQRKIADCLTSLDEVVAAQGRKVEALKAHKRGLMQQLFPCEGETRPRLRFPEFRAAPEWEEKLLDDLAKRGSGHTPAKSKPEYYNGGIKWVSLTDSKRLDNGYISETSTEISEEGIANSSAVLHSAGSVILCRDAGIGKSGIMKESMAVSQHFMVWTCDQLQLSNWFLYYLLQVMKPLFESVASGSTIKTIGLLFFARLNVIIPTLEEQHRIADCLSSLDAQIAAEREKLAALKTHKKGLMQQLFPSPEAD